jgi:hypothetical protein
MDWKLFAWLKRGSRRREVLLLLLHSDKPLSANEITTRLKIALSQSSFTLKELSEKELVICLNPSDKIGKLYMISDLGVEILNEI